jgi:hypothetical protein
MVDLSDMHDDVLVDIEWLEKLLRRRGRFDEEIY